MKNLPRYRILLLVLLLIIGIICAPKSCEWGNTVFFFCGIACLLLAVAISMFNGRQNKQRRLWAALGWLALTVVSWCALFLLLDFKIMCTLF